MWRRKPGLVAVALCLGGALTACGGGGDGEGYAAVGAGPSPKGAVAPSGVVTLVPLEPSESGTTSSTSSPSPGPSGLPGAPPTGRNGASPGPSGTSAASGTPEAPGSSRTSTSTNTGTGAGTGSGTAPTTAPGRGGGGTPPRTPSTTPGPTTPGTGTPPSSPTPTPVPGPAVLTVSTPDLAAGDKRWCQRVTVTFRNTGGSPATSGTVTFATHVIGLLGTDWGTVTSNQPLPAPIAAGAARTQTYTVCVESWRVPLGMTVDTRQVTATWS
ncbi:hypothetical protein ACFVIY_31715 [Streptomyces sp. NPDC127166]|uniref:hypothetical protein n=1 Tax=Streptomyces sp. NPDC127166 TaxID=3345380 RepID=UPI00362C8916